MILVYKNHYSNFMFFPSITLWDRTSFQGEPPFKRTPLFGVYCTCHDPWRLGQMAFSALTAPAMAIPHLQQPHHQVWLHAFIKRYHPLCGGQCAHWGTMRGVCAKQKGIGGLVMRQWYRKRWRVCTNVCHRCLHQLCECVMNAFEARS